MEYDTYGKTCSKDGAVVNGEVVFENKYVCDGNSFRVASATEIDLNKGCVSYTENEEIQKRIFATDSIRDSVYVCKNSLWLGEELFVFGKLLDQRDQKIYRTVTIGNQTWMAENLNYADSVAFPSMQQRNWCYENNYSYCTKYGRLYTWAAAIDSLTLATDVDNPQDCGYGKTCTLPTRVQGICPSGWHLPTSAEWDTLITNVGGQSNAGKMLKSQTGWYDGVSSDIYGFSALPGGKGISGRRYFSDEGFSANFWSATPINAKSSYGMHLSYDSDYAYADNFNLKEYTLSVRCLKD